MTRVEMPSSPYASLIAHRCAVTSVAWDGQFLWSGDEVGKIYRWDLNTRQPELVANYDDQVLAIRFSQEGKMHVQLRRGEILTPEGSVLPCAGGLFVRMSPFVADMTLIAVDQEGTMQAIKGGKPMAILKGKGKTGITSES